MNSSSIKGNDQSGSVSPGGFLKAIPTPSDMPELKKDMSDARTEHLFLVCGGFTARTLQLSSIRLGVGTQAHKHTSCVPYQ